MLRLVVIAYLVLGSQFAIASANSSLSERQTLLGLGSESYYVIAIESETRISHLESYQRVVLKQYDLNSNQLLAASVLSETQLSTNSDTWRQSVTKAPINTSELASVLVENVVRYAGYAKRPIKKFTFDATGLYLLSDGSRDYVLSLEEITQRIPNYEARLQYDFTKPIVEAIHSERTESGVKYLLVVRSGSWRSDTSSFEYVISLPEE